MELSILAVILGFILDLIVGDPHWLYHPIRLVGHLISGLEKILRKVFPKTERGELTAGVFLLILTAGITSGAAWILLYVAGCIHPYVKFALSVLMCYQLLATKSLKTETMKVYDALKEGILALLLKAEGCCTCLGNILKLFHLSNSNIKLHKN